MPHYVREPQHLPLEHSTHTHSYTHTHAQAEEYTQQLGIRAKELEMNPRGEEILFHTPRYNSHYQGYKGESPSGQCCCLTKEISFLGQKGELPLHQPTFVTVGYLRALGLLRSGRVATLQGSL